MSQRGVLIVLVNTSGPRWGQLELETTQVLWAKSPPTFENQNGEAGGT